MKQPCIVISDAPALTLPYRDDPPRLPVAGLASEVSVFCLAQLGEHVPRDWVWWPAVSGFFFRGGREVRLYPSEKE